MMVTTVIIFELLKDLDLQTFPLCDAPIQDSHCNCIRIGELIRQHRSPSGIVHGQSLVLH